MCGIIIYEGRRIKARDMIDAAVSNIHRGDDGVGILYKQNDKLYMEKFLYGLEEMSEKKLSDERTTKRVSIGSIEMIAIDKESYDKEQEKFEKKMEKLHNIESDFFVLHHRKSTYGDNTFENQHPIFYNDRYYVHNGTAIEFASVKTYLEIYEGHVFNTDTDTEVLSVLFNKLRDEYGVDTKKIYNVMKGMFPNGFGVLVEIDKDSNITICKDTSRELWKYTLEDDGIFLISEPIPEVTDYTTLEKVESGIHTLDSMRTTDYTPEINKLNKWWVDATTSVHDYTRVDKCDWCGKKMEVLSTFRCDGHPNESDRKDYCYNCLLTSLMYTNDDTDRLSKKRFNYGNNLGKVEVTNE